MATTIEWTPELEERLRASRAKKPLKKGGIIDAKGSAESMIKFIKKELGV